MILGIIIGLLVGLAILSWQHYRLKTEIAKILTFSPDITDLIPSLSILSLVHRELNYFEKLRQKQAKAIQEWQVILEYAPIGFLWIDEENQLLWCNRYAQTLLQLSRWQPTQVRLLLELVRSYELDQLIESTRSRQQWQTQEWLYYPSSYASESSYSDNLGESHRAIALKASAYPLSQGEIAVFIENLQPLRELAQSREQSFSDLTHELRTPLTSISLLAETLEKRLENPERRWAEQISQAVDRLISLIQEWLDLSQLQADPHRYLHYEPLTVQSLIQEAWHILEPLAQQKSLTLLYEDPQGGQLQGDRSRLVQAFLNILDNSLKHSPNGGKIRVNVAHIGEKLQIDLIDEGDGFTVKDLPHIFDRLYRGEKSRTRLKNPQEPSLRPGSGLGLSIAQQIIHAHKGTITAQNHPEEGGAWLQILLPPTP